MDLKQLALIGAALVLLPQLTSATTANAPKAASQSTASSTGAATAPANVPVPAAPTPNVFPTNNPAPVTTSPANVNVKPAAAVSTPVNPAPTPVITPPSPVNVVQNLQAAGITSTIAATPTVAPTTQAQLVQGYAIQGATGASAAAIKQEIAMASLPQATPIVNYTPPPASVSNLNAVYTGVGYYNPFTGVTHVPTMYA